LGKARTSYRRLFDMDERSPIKPRKLDAILEAIWDEYDYRLTAKVSDDDGSATRNETAKNFLRREVYALGRCLERSPLPSWSIEKFVRTKRENSTTRPEALSNIFHALLMCILREDYRTGTRITRQERSLMATELEYAHRHDVPPALLCGFLYQSTDRRKIRQLPPEFREPAFRS
jgi:hypothetical protein